MAAPVPQDPPRISRDLLVLGIAYRLQEIEHGGLGKATLRKLRTLAKTLRATGRVGPTPSLSLKPGARLVREWHGRTHTVTVTEDGFDYAGTSYPSLSKIAKKITGTHWSGPRFFGLLAKGKSHSERRRTMVESEKASRRAVKRLRCAIYTRKSTDEGLEKAFNSLDAQREACAAFIRRRSTRAGRYSRPSMTTAGIPAAPWSARPCNDCWPTSRRAGSM